jgi:DNA invertase Pin-like site-specific DNA recombinase
VYIRQSSPEQVRQNTGSTAVQRDLAQMLAAWGWPANMIEVRDEDLGRSSAAPHQRSGFTGLIREIQAGVWGIVAVIDISRLTRNDVEEALFATVARQHDVLLSIGTTIVDFGDANSAFIGRILGLNAGRENRVRIDLSRQAKRKKAESGKAVTGWSIGYIKGPDGTWLKDPDPQVRAVIQLVFDKFQELHSAGAVWRYLKRLGIKLPARFSGRTDP